MLLATVCQVWSPRTAFSYLCQEPISVICFLLRPATSGPAIFHLRRSPSKARVFHFSRFRPAWVLDMACPSSFRLSRWIHRFSPYRCTWAHHPKSNDRNRWASLVQSSPLIYTPHTLHNSSSCRCHAAHTYLFDSATSSALPRFPPWLRDFWQVTTFTRLHAQSYLLLELWLTHGNID